MQDTSFMDPWDYCIGPLVDLHLKFDVCCQFFLELLHYVIKLDYSAKCCICIMGFPNDKPPTLVKLSCVRLQSEVASVPKILVSMPRFAGSWKENYCVPLLFKILISRHLKVYHNVLCCVQKIKLSLYTSYPTDQGSVTVGVIWNEHIQNDCNWKFFMPVAINE